MSHLVLLEYIRAAKQLGADDAQIAARLASSGWYHVDIHDAIRLYRAMDYDQTVAQATSVVSTAPVVSEPAKSRSYDPQIIAVAAISFALMLVFYFAFFS